MSGPHGSVPGQLTLEEPLAGTGSGRPLDATAGRSIAARLARLHVRTGARALARAELETMAGRGELDREALADLAEVRWRTGDMAGAGEAAQAHLHDGGAAPAAYVVAVEALAASGRPRDARQLAGQFLAQPGIDEATVAAIFAGRSRSPVWPAALAARTAADGPPEAVPTGPAAAGVPVPAEGADAAGIEAAIARGQTALVAARLGLLLRHEPTLAPLVLSLAERALAGAGEWGPAAAQLHIACGDAYRLLGREHEASAAFQQSRRALAGPVEREGTP